SRACARRRPSAARCKASFFAVDEAPASTRAADRAARTSASALRSASAGRGACMGADSSPWGGAVPTSAGSVHRGVVHRLADGRAAIERAPEDLVETVGLLGLAAEASFRAHRVRLLHPLDELVFVAGE